MRLAPVSRFIGTAPCDEAEIINLSNYIGFPIFSGCVTHFSLGSFRLRRETSHTSGFLPATPQNSQNKHKQTSTVMAAF